MIVYGERQRIGLGLVLPRVPRTSISSIAIARLPPVNAMRSFGSITRFLAQLRNQLTASRRQKMLPAFVRFQSRLIRILGQVAVIMTVPGRRRLLWRPHEHSTNRMLFLGCGNWSQDGYQWSCCLRGMWLQVANGLARGMESTSTMQSEEQSAVWRLVGLAVVQVWDYQGSLEQVARFPMQVWKASGSTESIRTFNGPRG